MFRWFHTGQKQNLRNYLSYEQLIALSADKSLDTEETQQKKLILNTTNLPAEVTGIRCTDDGVVLDDTVLQEVF